MESQEIYKEGLNLVRKQALSQAIQIVHNQMKNTGDPRPLCAIIQQLRELMEKEV